MNVLIICIGNEFRGDDSAGIEIALRLRKDPALNVAVEVGDGVSLMQKWAGHSVVILVDAVSSGKTPGLIHHFDLNKQNVPLECKCCSTHAFGLAEAIELSRALNQLPQTFMMYGVEVKQVNAGEKLTPSVRKAIDVVVKNIRSEVKLIQEQRIKEPAHA